MGKVPNIVPSVNKLNPNISQTIPIQTQTTDLNFAVLNVCGTSGLARPVFEQARQCSLTDTALSGIHDTSLNKYLVGTVVIL